MSINLALVVSAWIERKGDNEAIEFFAEKLGKTYSAASVSNWRLMNVPPPLSVAQAVFDDSKVEIGAPQGGQPEGEVEVKPTIAIGEPFDGAKIIIGSPIYRDVSPWTYKATHVLRHKYGKQLGIFVEVGSVLYLTRNKIADRFLASDAEWLLWMDDDMAPPIGYPGESSKWGAKFDAKYNQVDVLERLMSHKQTFVGALYFDRNGQGLPMYAEGRNDVSIAQNVRRGPQDQIEKTDWIGAGCTLTHRRVYEDMLEKMPDIRGDSGKPNGFFTPLGHNYGEDASFAIRARTIGHQPYVDLGCICGHAGVIVHWNEKIR